MVVRTFGDAMEEILNKQQNNSETGFTYWQPSYRMYNKPVDAGLRWSNEATGSGDEYTPRGSLYLWGTSLGVTMNGKTLFYMKDVGIKGGNGHTDQNINSSEEAIEAIKSYPNNRCAYQFDSKKKKLIEKPPSDGSGVWTKEAGSNLFVWADEVISKERLNELYPPVSVIKHISFPLTKDNMHGWTASALVAKEHGGVLCSVKEVQAYIKKHGALVKGQRSWTATQEMIGSTSWVSCGE